MVSIILILTVGASWTLSGKYYPPVSSGVLSQASDKRLSKRVVFTFWTTFLLSPLIVGTLVKMGAM